MNGIAAGITAFLFLIFLGVATETNWTDNNELVFQYNLISGKAVTRENNPTLPYGWHVAVGWNEEFFSVNSEVNSYHFVAESNEALTWDTEEGATMESDFVIFGRVIDPWTFYAHYSKPDASYSGVHDIKDMRIYEALRQAGHFANARLCELTENQSADHIQNNPAEYASALTRDTEVYMKQYGFEVTQIMFPSRFNFPGGDAIMKARGELQNTNSMIQQKEQERDNATVQKGITISDAKIKALSVTGEGTRTASAMRAETEALAEQLKTGISQVGVDNTLKLFMVEKYGALVSKGVIPQAVVTGDSIFGKPFYSGK